MLCDPEHKANLEARNGACQLEYITSVVERQARRITESHVLELQSLAIEDIYPCGGRYRNAVLDVRIDNSPHVLPDAALVALFVRDAIDWINDERGDRGLSSLDKAAYALWRFNWIHPFAGGNGRTSRAIAYMIICMGNGNMLPGVPTMPTLISQRRNEYIEALRAADASVSNGEVPDFSQMTGLLRRVLVQQFATAIDSLGRRSSIPSPNT